MMATILISTAITIKYIVLPIAVAVPAAVATIVAMLRKDPYEEVAANVVAHFDAPNPLCLEEVLERDRAAAAPAEAPAEGVIVRFRPANRIRTAVAVAHEAYAQYGQRPRSQANELITRKFMRDLLAEIKDLRKHDQLAVIDLALPLSFLPSAEFRRMVMIWNTRTMSARADSYLGKPVWWRRALYNLGIVDRFSQA